MTFNENSRFDTGRVQRRGSSGANTGGLAIGGGIGGLLLVLVFLFLGVDIGGSPASNLSSVQDNSNVGDFDERCATGASANQYADCRVVGAIHSLDDYWSEAFPVTGHSFKLPDVIIFDNSTQSACGPATAQTGPFYCPPDQGIYVDTTFFNVLVSQFGSSGGPLAEMYVIAHEYGHHLQNLMGVFEVADRSKTGADSDGVKVELMADCLAGVWAGHAATTTDKDGNTFLQPFSESDLQDALSAAEAVGDDRIQETVQGEADPHTFTHGTSEQRREAFIRGYEYGTVTACDAFGLLG